MTTNRKCGIPAQTLPPCDLEWGHDGDMHANGGDGFYARQHDHEHHVRQRIAKEQPHQPVGGMTYEERCEFDRLKEADVEQGRRIAELIAERDALKADLERCVDNVRVQVRQAMANFASVLDDAINAISVRPNEARLMLTDLRDGLERVSVVA